MSLWDWTVGAYARPGTPEATLDLQDRYGQNTAFLLWAVWAEGPPDETLAKAAAMTKSWDQLVLMPLRDVRRKLKPALVDVNDGARQALREDVKSAELRAERVLMESLEAMCGAAVGGRPALESLRLASATWGDRAPESALAVLAGALG